MTGNIFRGILRPVIVAMALLLFLVQAVSGQGNRPRKQTIIMNDGTWIVGSVLADTSGFMRINVAAPHIVTIRKSQVASIQAFSRKDVATDQTHKGYFIKFTGSILAGKNEFGKVGSPSFHLSNGYQSGNGFSAGLGTGIEELDVSILPLYAEFGYHPFQTRVSPFVWIKSGYGFTLADRAEDYYTYSYGSEYEGGFLFSTGAGIALYSWRRNAICIGLGYRFQQISVTEATDWWMSTTSREYITRFNRMELQLGFIFR
ncbi:MAG: hypothetical protein IH591_20530 [Bacteroidales bacterium]|nr:hypothetical protein [Bacteroidales bacterium]